MAQVRFTNSILMDYTPYLYVGAIPAVLIGQIYFLGVRMSKPERMLRFLPGGLSPREQGYIDFYRPWLESQKLRYLTALQFGRIRVAVFQQENQPRFFSFYFHQRVTFDIESYTDDLTILDTTNSGESGLFPRPNAYVQSLPGATAEAMWQQHLEGEAHLAMKFRCRWVPLKRPYEELLPDAIRLRMQSNRSQFLWPVRVLYRFFVTRFAIRNKTIAQQYP